MTRRGQEVLASLTPRQKELVPLVAEGLTNRDIGKRANLPEQVVKNYLNVLFEKVGIHNRVELVVFSYYHGILECPCSARMKKLRVEGVI